MVKNFIDRLKSSLQKTRSQFIVSLSKVLPVGRIITDDVLDEVEEILYSADIGVNASEQLIEELRCNAVKINRGETDPFSVMKASILSRINRIETTRGISVGDRRPLVLMMVGVNGTGKTTSIGKLAMRFRKEGKSVLLAACDTFRAAAVEQLEVWAHRADAEFLGAQNRADPASIAFDAVKRAKARMTDVVIIDTAGRLHTSKNLMEELKKIDKVLKKADESESHESLLVLDATTGQNALNQAEVFSSSLNIMGIVLTKLDGTAKGGIVISIIDKLGIPIKLIGVGEGIDDLRDFNAAEFVDALFEK